MTVYSIFWLSVPKGEVRDAILDADFDQARDVLRAAQYRNVITGHGITDDRIDTARDSLKTNNALLDHLRGAYLNIFNAANGEDREVALPLAGLRIRRALQGLGDSSVKGECPLIPIGQAIAKDIHRLAMA